MSEWPVRDIAFFAILIFNAGGLVYLFRNHMRHVNASLDRIKEVLSDPRYGVVVRLARVEEKVERFKCENS